MQGHKGSMQSPDMVKIENITSYSATPATDKYSCSSVKLKHAHCYQSTLPNGAANVKVKLLSYMIIHIPPLYLLFVQYIFGAEANINVNRNSMDTYNLPYKVHT